VVAEIQGLYGPFSFPEVLLQKIWMRGDFDRAAAKTTDGQAVRILYPGKWNLLGGPDFKGARLGIGARETSGDVELHLHAVDWDAHRHAADPGYDSVALHAVLFPPEPGYVTRGAGGHSIPTLPLLSLLFHDLEEYAAAEAIETLANRPGVGLIRELGVLPAEELAALIHGHARKRWRQKIHFARLRIKRLGWDEACHHVALEILGYRFNRVPMLRIAAQFPLATWSTGAIEPGLAYAAEEAGWGLQGVRPANRPRMRVEQYSRWSRARPSWVKHLEEVGRELPLGDVTTGVRASDFRREHKVAGLRRKLGEELVADALGGTRFDTLVCDGFLPMLAARAGSELESLWFHWYAGDQPPHIRQALRTLGLSGLSGSPICQGLAQGFLGWLIEREARSASARTRGAPLGRGA